MVTHRKHLVGVWHTVGALRACGFSRSLVQHLPSAGQVEDGRGGPAEGAHRWSGEGLDWLEAERHVA